MRDYKVILIEKTDFTDDFGNTWTNVVLEGEGEPVKLVLKDPDSVKNGDTIHGDIEIKTSRAGKPYNKFKRGKPEDGGGKSEWKPKDEKQITRNMCWKNLLTYFDVPTMLPDTEQWQTFWGLVDLHTEMLLPKSDKPEPNVLNEIKGDVGNPALRKGLAKTGHTLGVADNEPLPIFRGDEDDTD